MFSSTRKAKQDGVKTEFVYADGAKDDVQLSGDWNDWKAIQMFHEGGGMWSVVTPVPPGPHEFKFIVDGEWKHSNRHPTIGIDDTSLNNVRVVLPQPDLGDMPRTGGGSGGGSSASVGSAGGDGSTAATGSKAARESRAKARESRVKDARHSKAKRPGVGAIFGK